MSQSLSKNLLHLIFSTKHHERSIIDSVRPALHAYISGVLRDLGSPAIAINSLPDHIHILFKLDKDSALSKVVMEVKRSSSRWIKTIDPSFRAFRWQSGYGAFSISQSMAAQVKTYIRNQAEHHRKKTFQEEFRSILSRYEIEYNERYLWD